MKKLLCMMAITLCFSSAAITVSAHGSGAISLGRAKKIAMETVRGRIVNVGLEHENNQLVYDVDMKKGTESLEVIINATTGKVMHLKKVISNP